MAYCTNCGSELDPSAKLCPGCGSEVETIQELVEQQACAAQSAPADSPEAEVEQGDSANPVDPVCSDAPSMGAPASDPVSAPAPANPSEGSASAVPAPNSFLQGWKTSVGMTIVGVVCAMILSSILASMASLVLSSIIHLVYIAAALVYAAAFIPSFFSEQPKLQDAKVVSFLNGLLGGIVFGCLWNSSLTKRVKGVSYIVCIVLYSFSGLASIGVLLG